MLERDQPYAAGDNLATAEAVAREVGIVGVDVAIPSADLGGSDVGGRSLRQSMTATEFDALDKEGQLQAVKDLRVLARVEPHHKQRLVELLQAEDEVPHPCCAPGALSA